MSSAKGFPAVPHFDHRLCCCLGYIRCIRHHLGASLLVDCTPFMAAFPYQTLNNNEALVPAANIVYHIVVITGPFSCLELEYTSRSAYWSPWLAENLARVSAILLRHVLRFITCSNHKWPTAGPFFPS